MASDGYELPPSFQCVVRPRETEGGPVDEDADPCAGVVIPAEDEPDRYRCESCHTYYRIEVVRTVTE